MSEDKHCPECGSVLGSYAPGVYLCENCWSMFKSAEWERRPVPGELGYVYYADVERARGTWLGLRIDLGFGVHIKGDMLLDGIAVDADVEDRIRELTRDTVVVDTMRRSTGKGLVWMVRVRLPDGRDLSEVLIQEGAARALIS